MRTNLHHGDHGGLATHHWTMGIPTYQEYIKKLEQERFESDIREAHEVLQHMGSRLQSLEKNDQSAWKPRRHRKTQGGMVSGVDVDIFYFHAIVFVSNIYTYA